MPTGPPLVRRTISSQAADVSFASAGRTTVKFGMRRSVDSCSIGWCVGPSSPRATESCVHTKIDGMSIRAARRTGGRM
jgi:hypothetical protein